MSSSGRKDDDDNLSCPHNSEHEAFTGGRCHSGSESGNGDHLSVAKDICTVSVGIEIGRSGAFVGCTTHAIGTSIGMIHSIAIDNVI